MLMGGHLKGLSRQLKKDAFQNLTFFKNYSFDTSSFSPNDNVKSTTMTSVENLVFLYCYM